jgi:glycosyltransferase involved in cell wall biosynthesis
VSEAGTAAAASPAVSVVVPARDAAATIGATLAALARQDAPFDHEVIVVDSGSHDATATIAAADGATVLHNPGGEPAGSRNLGASHGRGGVLAFTDADCAPEPGWLAAGLRALDAADLVQGAVHPAGPVGRYDRTVSVGAEHGLYETANLFVTRAAFERVGGFQPVPGLPIGTGQPFGEDAWFAWRARRAGARTAFAPDAIVRHAVFPRAARDWIMERARCRYFPPLVALIPELRATLLRRRLFLSEDTLRFDFALAGLVLASLAHRRWPALAILPYAAALTREARDTGASPPAASAAFTRVVARIAADALTAGALALGSVRARTPVL